MSPSQRTASSREEAYRRTAFLAVQALDAVTLVPVSSGLEVDARGLQGRPSVNRSGVFAWRTEDFALLERVTIEPKGGVLPYGTLEIPAADLTEGVINRVELPPRVDYPFGAGITGLRGSLIASRAVQGERPVPVADASVRLRWLDDDGDWRDAPTTSRTNAHGGFAAIVRLAAMEIPEIANGRIRVRLHALRDGAERRSADLEIPIGRVVDPSTFDPENDPLTFAWDELRT